MTRLHDRIADLLQDRPAGIAHPLQRVQELVQQAPDRLVVTEGAVRLSRAGLLDKALRLGGALRARGIGRGAAIAFQLPNWWEACVIGLAATLFGYRLVPLLTIYRAAELSQMLPACGVQAIFIPGRLGKQDFPALVAGLPGAPPHVFVLRDAARGGGEGFDALLSADPAAPDPGPAADARTVIFTSGSTGRPKGVIHSHATMDATVRLAAGFWGITDADVLYVPSPIAHIGGVIYAFDFPWITGCRVVLDDRWDPAAAVRRIDAEGATFMAGATPFLSGLIAAADAAGSHLSSLRRFVCGGASVPPDLVRQGLRAFPATVVSRAYGSSEVPLVCPGVRTRADAQAQADTDGEIACDLRLLDDAGRTVPSAAEGEIAVRAPQMFPGYLDPRDDADSFTADGFFRMGDLGRVTGERFLTITGRKKDIIIRKGENISPLEIENALMRHPSLQSCAVVGRPDPARGEMVVAFVVPKPGASFDFAAMTAHLETLGLARQKFPECLRLVPDLPVNAVGKVQKPQLREMAMQPQGETR